MLTAVITGPDLFSAKRQIKKAKENNADAIEIRLDCLDAIDLDKISKLKDYWENPVIFSLRRSVHGGKYLQHEKKLYFDLTGLFSLKPDYFDLEHDMSLEFIEKMKALYPNTKIIFSYHNFEKKPSDLNQVFESLKNPYSTYYKIAVFVKDSLEALEVLEFIKEKQNENLIVVPMGPNGSFVRILSQIYNNKVNYCFVDKKNNLGQISLEDMDSVYRCKNINANTEIYALLGHPVEQSIGHVFHNAQFAKKNKNAVYVKINLQPQDLPIFFSKIKQFAFKGFSIAMPLKEKILAFVDVDNSKVGSINTVLLQDQKIIGYNTDGVSALDAIERKIKVEDKKILLIGSGGVAKAIAFEAVKRGANLIIFNRDQSKAYNLASKLQCQAYPIEKLKEVMAEGYCVIINATSSSMENINIVPFEYLIPGTIAMDVVSNPVETVFLKKAQEKGCLIIYGMELFINQARRQFV